MRILLKILVMPFVAALTIIDALLMFLLFLSAWAFYAVAFVCGLLAIVTVFQGLTSGGVGTLIMSFIIFIMPSIVEWLAERLDDLNCSLKDFIAS